MTHPRKVRRTHTLPPTAPLSQQVGGHAGVHVTEDESLLLKPALPREISFYQLIRDVADPATGLHSLRPWVPKFFGLLSLAGKLADQTGDTIAPVQDLEAAFAPADVNGAAPSQTLVLQNLLYGYRKPCILDVKLGTVLHDEDASEEKKARMIKKAAETTSLQTGVRLTGFQVYSNHSPDPVVYGKTYGYSLKPERLHEGITNFFPCSVATLLDANLETSSALNSNRGLPADTLLVLLTSLHTSLIDLRASLSTAHVRIVGGSVLIVYEGDWERAAAASGRGGGPGSFDEAEDEEDEDADSEVQVDEEGQIIAASASETSDTDLPANLYTISLIDFAHTRIVPGEGPDRGVLLGMETLIGLVAQRKEEIAAGMYGSGRVI